MRYGANSVHRGDPNATNRFAQRFSASYVTGSHNFKVGVLLEELVRDEVTAAVGDLGASVEFRQTQSFRPGRPVPTHRFDGSE